MTEKTLFAFDTSVSQRQPKTDRLILAELLRQKARNNLLEEEEMRAGHAVLVKWADLETSGRLATFKGIHEKRTLLPGHVTTAERIVQKYAEMSFPG